MKIATFYKLVAALSVLSLLFVGQIVSNGKTREALARETNPAREQLINRVTQPYNRMVSMCDYLAQFSYLVPQEQLPSKCAQLRAAGPEAVARMRAMKDLNLLSRQVDQFEITVGPEIQKMEAAYATAQRLMK